MSMNRTLIIPRDRWLGDRFGLDESAHCPVAWLAFVMTGDHHAIFDRETFELRENRYYDSLEDVLADCGLDLMRGAWRRRLAEEERLRKRHGENPPFGQAKGQTS